MHTASHQGWRDPSACRTVLAQAVPCQWCGGGSKPGHPENARLVFGQAISSIRAETTMYLCGDSCLDVWANMNSSAVPPSAEARLVKTWGGLVHETVEHGSVQQHVSIIMTTVGGDFAADG